jgi:hypothetical protein
VSTPTRKKSNGAGIAVLVVGAAVLVGMGWFSAGHEDPEDRRVEVELEVTWGVMSDDHLRCDERPVKVRYWVDGQQYGGDLSRSDSDEPCYWLWTVDVPVSTEIRLQVTEIDEGRGWKQCSIYVDGRLAVPNGMARARGTDACEVHGVAL